jgi:ferredoxin--NADP+ reductase
VTQRLALLLEEAPPVDAVHHRRAGADDAAVAEVTRPRGVRTIASLNPLMVDGTGMCGGWSGHRRGEQRFACVDGP